MLSFARDTPCILKMNPPGRRKRFRTKRALHWITHRVVVVMVGEHDAARYTLATHAQRQGGGMDPQQHHHHDDHDGRVGSHTTRGGMLTSLKDGASLDKIHNMHKMMASGSETKYN